MRNNVNRSSNEGLFKQKYYSDNLLCCTVSVDTKCFVLGTESYLKKNHRRGISLIIALVESMSITGIVNDSSPHCFNQFWIQ